MFNSIKEHVFSIDRMRMMTRGSSKGCLKVHKTVCFQATMDLKRFLWSQDKARNGHFNFRLCGMDGNDQLYFCDIKILS